MKMLKHLSTVILAVSALSSTAQISSDFENLSLPENSYWNGSDDSKSFESGEARFLNSYNPKWASWSGFAYSNKKDKTSTGLEAQFSSYAGGAHNNSNNYAIAYLDFYSDALVWKPIAKGCKLKSIAISNCTFTANDLKTGSSFSKKFGGPTGNDPDFLKLHIINYSKTKADTITVILADYRFADNQQDYIMDTWQTVNLSKFSYSDSLQFKLESSDVGSFGINTPSYFCIDDLVLIPAPFAPPAKQIGTTAIAKDSSIFVSWASAASLNRGPRDISLPSAGLAEVGNENAALGIAGSNNGVVSLGDGGSIVLSFTQAITNQKGFDFAVFENSFSNTFLELAFVEVSSDGKTFVRFPATSYSDTSTQTDAFGSTDSRMIHNLAGKYEANFGTPFDLEELKDSSKIDINQITHIKIIDVVGSLDPNYATRDIRGVMINDPWPTNFGSSGFDLDAVGVIHQVPLSLWSRRENNSAHFLYPNPALGSERIQFNSDADAKYTIYNAHGAVLLSGTGNEIQLPNIPKGVYTVQIVNDANTYTDKLMVR
jgi:hypothetical protein